MIKHAFLILAHTEFDILRMLVSRLDDRRNDIYVHFDRKVQEPPVLHTEQAGLTILENRIDVHWGAPSMLEAEFALFGTAQARGPYQYYHLLSGVDLPLKNQDDIHWFFDKYNGKEFIGYTLTDMTPEFVRKVRRWHLFPEDYKSRDLLKRALRAGFLRLQEVLGIYRNEDIDFKKGSQWVSVTEGMALWFVNHRKWAQRVFRNTFCPDELLFQTLAWMSPFRRDLYNTTDDATGCMRAIGWRKPEKDGNPWMLKDWSAEDYETLKDSPALFARKFNSSDPEFLKKILELSRP